jgi:two-component system response regulator RegX3
VHIGILEDDEDQLALIQLWLQGGRHTCTAHLSVSSMLEALRKGTYDLLLLDWMLQDGSGLEVLRWVRANLGWNTAVVVLTAREEEQVVVQALEAGADDYVVKPAKQHELLARLASAGRRARGGSTQVLRLGAYEVDSQRNLLLMDGRAVALTQKEFDLASYLFQNPGKLVSRDHLLDKVWGINAMVDTRTVDTHVSRLRKKLLLDGAKGWKMSPVYGFGYRMDRLEQPA